MNTGITKTQEKMKLPSDRDSSGRNFGKEEVELLKQVIKSGNLFSISGTMCKKFEEEFSKLYNVKYTVCCSSGSAAIYTALAAINPNPGDEVITTPITDMGALTPIIYQNAVPVFCDVDPQTYNVTAETIAKKITPKTRAIIVTHLFGGPCEMDAIMELARKHNIPVIEDCAQAFLAEYHGKLVGTIGDIGCFSTQQGKHLSSGEGGFVITNNPDYARRMRLFVNKAWGYGDPKPDHYFLSLNYRISELTGAVLLAQLSKLDKVVKNRCEMAAKMDKMLSKVKGLSTPKVYPDCKHTYWKYCLRIDEKTLGADVVTFANKLKDYDLASAPRYIQKPAFMCSVIKDANTFGTSHYPLEVKNMDNWQNEYPGTQKALAEVLVLPWNEFYKPKHVKYIADSIKDAAKYFKENKGAK